ncbi:hypothetical protein [Streptomyces carpaticus]|uniref:YcxB family protein n=1 Tax=Streptomyces carpaticus TaxID=285558 RepID=A0ABV4ZTQ3_9ACTN
MTEPLFVIGEPAPRGDHGPLEFRGRFTTAELIEGRRARRGAPALRVAFHALMAAGLMAAVALVTSAHDELGRIVVVSVLVIAACGAFGGVFAVRMQLVRIVRRARREGECTITLGEDAIQIVEGGVTTRIPRQRFPFFTETRRSFALFTSRSPRSGVLVIPKRFAGRPADVDRARTVLSGSWEPLGRA